MASVLGLDCYLYRNTGTHGTPTLNEVPNVRDLEVELSKETADATSRANGGWKATVGTLKDLKLTWDMVYDPADADVEALRDAYLDNTTVELFALDGPSGTTGSAGPRASCSITAFKISQKLADVVMVSVEAVAAYSANPPAWYEVP